MTKLEALTKTTGSMTTMTDKPRFTVLHGSGQRAEDLTGEMAERIKEANRQWEEDNDGNVLKHFENTQLKQ